MRPYHTSGIRNCACVCVCISWSERS